MNRGIRALAVSLSVLAFAACAKMEAEERAADPSLQGVRTTLAQYPGAKEEFESYYEDHAAEGDYSCGLVDIGDITRVSRLSETPSQVRLAIHYEFQSEDLSSQQSEYCAHGFNTRIVTYDRVGGGVKLVSMTGETR